MNTAKETKTKTKTFVAVSLAILLSLASNSAQSATVDDLATQKADQQKKLDAITAQIHTYQSQIGTLQNQESTLKNEITIYNDQIASNQLQIQLEQTRISDTQLQIGELKKLIAQKNQDIEDNKKILGRLIVQLNEMDDQYLLQSTVGSDNLSDFLDQVQYTSDINGKVYQLVKKIQTLRDQLQQQQNDLQVELKNLQDLEEQLQITQDDLTNQRSQRQKLLAQTSGSEKNFQKLLASSKTQESSIQEEIDNLDNQIRAKLGNKTINPNAGALAWPMDGVITQGYGNTGFTSLGYSFHNGIDIAAPAGQAIYSAADGVVLDIDHSNQAYGNWVAVKSTIKTADGPRGIVALYGHMRTIKVNPGQTLSQGDIIGYEGNTGNTTAKLYGPERGYHLHFTIFDTEGFGVQDGAYTKIYGPYRLPFGYTYNPLNFLPQQ